LGWRPPPIPFLGPPACSMACAIIAELHSGLLQDLAGCTGVHFQGLRAAAAFLRRGGCDATITKRLCRVDDAFSISRHITCVSADRLRWQVWQELAKLEEVAKELKEKAAKEEAAAVQEKTVKEEATKEEAAKELSREGAEGRRGEGREGGDRRGEGEG
jgi:hypothetical protein